MSDSFVHLHLHTEFSLLDGMIRTRDLAKRAADLGMPAVAMTDHGNLYGAIQFYQNCLKQKVKPIFGCEIYLAPLTIEDRREISGRKRATHLTLLAETNLGWKNLSKLVSYGHLDGLHYGKPRVDREALRKYSQGLICLTGCISGPVNEWLLQDNPQKARETLAELVEIYGRENTYVELHNHSLEPQLKVLPLLVELAAEFGLRTVAANDVHFMDRTDHDAHDIMICIGTGKKRDDQIRMHYSPELHFKTPAEMRALFADHPGACDATLEIAERCNVTFNLDPTSSEKYPQFGTPDGSPREEYLMRLCREGALRRYGAERAVTEEISTRLKYEVDTINQLGFASYFLITADFIGWARDHDIPVGPGRGSAAGSLVAYTLGITDICPLQFGLLFERFLNPERVSPPDVDIDFCQSRRNEVIGYVREKYGERSVSHIITYGTLGAKSVLRDVARVMNVGYSDADRIAKMIEARPGVTLSGEWEAKPDLRELIEGSTLYRELWEFALKLEGLNRNVGVHAAGVVIGDRPLDEHVPVTRGNEGEVVTQYDMGAITEVGLLKMDFLGLKNLTVIHDAVQHIRRTHPNFVIEAVPLDDQPTFDILNRGETMGVFQLESGGMVETCKKYQIEKIDDIIDLLALYRPGAMQFIDQMIEVKKGRKRAMYEHPLLEQVCGNTYGVMIYQEQVQNAAKMLAGYTLGGADLLRRAMGKKDPKKMAEERGKFVAGAAATNGISEKLANQIFDKIAMFAGYGFNKSHSACYGHISYWTAYLKANHPVEFMAALLSNEIHNTDKIGIFVAECHRMGIAILPPDINASQLRFHPEIAANGNPAIRYGLAAIKNCGEAAMAIAIADRAANGAFPGIEEFASRLDSRVINKRILESLIKAGALDWTKETRAAMHARLEQVLAAASAAQKDRASGQVSLFDAPGFDVPTTPPTRSHTAGIAEEWTKDERLGHEKELLGFYVTGHPLDKFRGIIDTDKYERLGMIDELEPSSPNKRFAFAGMVRSIEWRTSKSNKLFAILVLEDFTGSSEIMMWSDKLPELRISGLLESGRVVTLKASVRIDDRTESKRLTAYDAEELVMKRPAAAIAKAAVELTLHTTRHTERDLEEIHQAVARHPGKTPLVLHFLNGTGGRTTIIAGDDLRVKREPALESALTRWLDT